MAESEPKTAATPTRRLSIDWYAPGQSRTFVVGGQAVTVRFVGGKGRRGRIAIVATAGAAFRSEPL